MGGVIFGIAVAATVISRAALSQAVELQMLKHDQKSAGEQGQNPIRMLEQNSGNQFRGVSIKKLPIR